MHAYDDWYFKPSKPREARGGIKSRSKRGAFGSSWWAKRWIGALERFDVDGRLARGRTYARAGQVLSIAIEKGRVAAKVQGSRPAPYKVSIDVRILSAKQWDTLAEALSQQAIFAARLLAGEMPEEIEEVFRATGIPLFPAQARDLETACSCPDWSNPCKHIAAVYYLLGEEFDRDPFLMFKLRGLEREELMAKLVPVGEPVAGMEAAPALPAEPLRAEPASFWGAETYADPAPLELRIPPVPAALVRQLGGFPFWRGESPLEEGIVEVYTEVGRTLGDAEEE